MDLAYIRVAVMAAVAAAALTLAYSWGGEAARAAHEAYIAEQRVKAAEAQALWAEERRQLQSEVTLARRLAQSAVASISANDEDAERRIAAVAAGAHSAPMPDDVLARVNAIVDEANR